MFFYLGNVLRILSYPDHTTFLSLGADEQLCRGGELKTFHLILNLYMDMLNILSAAAGMELFHVC